MDYKRDLDDAIQHLYSVFAAYGFPEKPSYCSHCITEEEDRKLRSRPLRELTGEELARYSWKAITTWGTVDQFKHLLPRLLETVVTGAYPYNPEILFKKPRYGDLGTWPAQEQKALSNYCEALWRYALSRHPLTETLPSFPSIDDCLCCIGQIVDDLNPLLEYWASAESSSANLHLVDFAAENASHLRELRKLSNAFWDERNAQMQQAADWFMSQDFALSFDVALAATTDWELREDLTKAILRRRTPASVGPDK